MDVLQWSRHYRCFPGQGGLDVAAVLRETLAAGYAGPLSLEVFNDVFRAADPERMAVDAMRSLLILEDALPATRRARRLRVRRARARLDLRARDRGHARGARLHPHRPAPLQAGAAVGAGRRARRDQPRRGARHAARRRARVRDARTRTPPRPAPRRCTRRCCPSAGARTRPRCARSRAPDGTAVIFCRAWHHDFLAVAEPEAGPLRAIDHLALSQPFDYFDEAALFYRSVLGLHPHEIQELAAPDGLIRSRAVGDRERRVRLALNVPLVAGGTATELQHIAFACDDALAAAHRCAEAGVPLLPISDNYYDDLAARTGARRTSDRGAARRRRPLRRRRARRAPALLHRGRRRPAVLRGARAARRLRRLRRRQLRRAPRRPAQLAASR